MATGIQVWSNTPVTNATADSNVSWAEGMAPSQVNDSARAMMSSVAKWRDDNNTTLITSGTTAALTVVTNQVESALTAGYTVAVTFGTAVDSNATLAVDGLAAKPIQMTAGTNIFAGTFSSGDTVQLVYSTTGTGQWYAKNTPPVLPPGDPSSPAGGQLAGTPPAAWTNTTAKMMGLGSTFVFVPKTTGRCILSIQQPGVGSTTMLARPNIYYGTGGAASAPTSGAAVTGSSAGISWSAHITSANLTITLAPSAIVTGLTIGTSYWVDLSFLISGGTWTSSGALFTYQEF